MTPRAARRVTSVQRSATVAALDIAQLRRARGAPVYNLSGGEPNFTTPPNICDAAVTALDQGHTHYTASRGILPLRRAIADQFQQRGVAVDPETEIVVTPSAKHALFLALATVLDPGDEVLIPSPGWVSYAAMATLLGARAVAVPLTPPTFDLTLESLAIAVTARTRAIIVNSPNNPTGRVLTLAEADELANFAIRHDLVIITDEIYDRIVFNGQKSMSLAAVPGCAERTLSINGFSKTYAMTGWRLGYVGGPAHLMSELLKVQEHTVGCASSFVQHAGIVALQDSQESVQRMVAEYDLRRRLTVDSLNARPGLDCPLPQGAFYAFFSCAGTGLDGPQFVNRLLSETGVLLTPGNAFGEEYDHYVRLSFAADRQVLTTALDQLAAAVASW
jgi:aspartate aminotransferase